MKEINKNRILLELFDIVLIALCCVFSYILLKVFSEPLNPQTSDLIVSVIAMPLSCVIGMRLCGAYNAIIKYSNVTDYFRYLLGLLSGTVLYYLAVMLLNAANIFEIPLSEVFGLFCNFLTYAAIIASRILYYYVYDIKVRSGKNKLGSRTLIVGGGELCRQLLIEMKRSSEYAPICILDDDPAKLSRKIDGVPIVGTTNSIGDICLGYDIDTIFIAMPSCTEEKRRRILKKCSDINCRVRQIPYMHELISDNLLSQAHNIHSEELLERPEISFDNEKLKEFITDKVCLVAGAGSIGGEIAFQIARYNPKLLIILDYYENNAYDVQQQLRIMHGDKLNLVTIIASVCDYERMRTVFETYKIDAVFHCAAHKHIPLMEMQPMEAIKNNILGLLNVATLAEFYSVPKFVFVSSNIAVYPKNVLGATKACCEMIMQYMAQNDNDTDFITTRFGNVLDSNGSVVPLFRKQIESGGPVTVTHPDIVRDFITLPEAASLVLQSAAMALGGEIFVLYMNRPVKIAQLAEKLIKMYGKIPNEDIEIKFTGLRPGEMISDRALFDRANVTATENEKIFIGTQPNIDADAFFGKLSELKAASNANDIEKTVALLKEIVPIFDED